ncbi:hypothetical protein [Paraburkholderia nodosa]|uniref:hypothetical protein n=1 Tax=Paraburkholderia nodosa TaxID=392320 RepID=UPI00047F1720|nr:hypothetical protein [Paraburkholderia nodosa]
MARLDFVRTAIAIAKADGVLANARQVAVGQYGSRSDITGFLERAAEMVGTGSFVDANGDPVAFTSDTQFITLINNGSLIGKIESALGGGWRATRPMELVAVQQSGAVASWTPEAAVKMIDGSADFLVEQRRPRKVTATLIRSTEFAKFGSESAELALQRDLVRAVVDELNRTLISDDPPTAASPGGLLYGVPALPSTGSLDGDVAELVANFSGDLSRAVLISNPRMGASFAAAGFDQTAGARGGFVAGFNFVTAEGLPDGLLALLDASRVLMHDGPVIPGSSTHGTVTADMGNGEQPLSLWQNNLAALRAEKFADWRALDGAIVWTDDAPTRSVKKVAGATAKKVSA